METSTGTRAVYRAINAVQADLSKTGISKDRTNTQGSGYKFRGIDDVYNAVAPLLAKHGLCVIPRVLRRESVERTSKNGGALFYVTVEAEFDFVASEDGSMHTARTFGEAMDSGDKATNKAMSAAYKYVAFQIFAIPTEGNNDADSETHEVKHRFSWIDGAVEKALELNEAGDEVGAFGELYEVAMGDDQEAQLYAWKLMGNKGVRGSTPGSRLRATLKRLAAQEREIADMPSVVEAEPA